MIKNLKIENFRCIPYFELENVKPINIFVGRNNTGKSSILEAIALAYTSPTGFLDAFGNDLLEVFIERRGGFENIKYFIKVGEKETNIEINKEKRLKIMYKDEGLPAHDQESFKKLILQYIHEEYISSIIRRAKRLKKVSEKDEMEYYIEEKRKELFKNILESKKLSLVSYNNKEPISYCIVTYEGDIIKSKEIPSNIIFESAKTAIDLEEIYNSLVSKGEIINLINMLKKNLHIEDLRVANGEIYVFQEGVKKPIPLSLMGDGFLALLRKIVIDLYMDRGIVILEEPENNMHPGYLEFMVKELSESAREGKMQLFISTHSLELIEDFLEIEENRDILQIIKMFRDGEEIEYEIMDFNEAKKGIKELGDDLRGI